ncbi:hypothetical protein SLH46_20945 [Draconibacterium sp. IB214405]|nr:MULTISPECIES: hypothetical protein [Draconibacterium]MDX8341679.1 hypothetical protein [Draconibacterium sp. IB214405]
MEKKNRNKYFENVSNEKQNSLSSGIRIGEFGIVFVLLITSQLSTF